MIASTVNRTRGPSNFEMFQDLMATMDFTTKPPMLSCDLQNCDKFASANKWEGAMGESCLFGRALEKPK